MLTAKVLQRVEEFEQRGHSLQLVVAVHAFTYNRQRLGDVLEIVKNKLPNADIFAPDYPSGLFSSVDLFNQSHDIAEAIKQRCEDRMKRSDGQSESYQSIILIGHSLGALLVRMIYLIARGYAPGGEYSRTGLKPVAMDWHAQVERIILFAGMNRGWGLEERPDYMSWPIHLLCRFLLLIEWLLPSNWGRMILSVRRGAPFVVNLRLRWLTLERQNPSSFPKTIQLLGTNDTMVKTDSVDPESGSNFIYKKMPKAGHLNIVRFTHRKPRRWWKILFEYLFGPRRTNETDKDLDKRKEIFVQVLTEDAVQSDFCLTDERPKIDHNVKHAVLIMHGIRDRGAWTSSMEKRLKELGNAKGLKPETQTSSYGYFPMLPFLLRIRRQEKVRIFADWYTQFIALYPSAKIGFIGHSNGTYLAASFLNDYDLVKFDNLVFAGSVVARHYKWEDKFTLGHVNNLCNIMAHGDWIVAWFPRLFEMFTEVFANQNRPQLVEIGSAGFNGFDDGKAKTYEVAYLKGGHNVGLKEELYEPIAKFILDGPPMEINNSELMANHQLWWVNILSKFCWIVWLGIAALIIWFGALFVKLVPLVLLHFFGYELSSSFAGVLYILLLLIILLQV